MTNESHRVWDVSMKLVGFIGVCLGLVMGFYQFIDVRERELQQFADLKEREFYSEFWGERLRLYVRTLETTAAIAHAESDEAAEDAIREFRLAFDGSMTVVQDPIVDAKMHEFEKLVDQVASGEIDREDLGFYSYELGRVCYESLRDSWNQPFSATEDAE